MWLDAAGFRGHIAAVTEEDVEPAEAQHETGKQRPEIRWGVVASVAAHIPIVALLIFGLPKIEPKPAEDESVKVELVPPPEEKKPEPKPKPPEPKPPEEAKKEPPPPPPPPPPASKTPEQAKPRPMPTLSPVIEFGDRNSGPKKSLAGNSPQGETKPATTPPQHDAEPAQMPTKTAAEKPKTEEPPSKPVPDDVKLPEVATTDVSPERNGPPTDVSGEANTSIEEAKPPEQQTAEKPKVIAKDDLPKAKTLFSRTEDGSLFAQTAVSGLPRKERVATLCTTELQGQLVHGSPPYFPSALPSFGLRTGTILDVRDAAFGTFKGWYQVRFRCEVDEEATKVVSFAHEVGGLIPRSQYAKYEIRD
ncbi:DUF930 domain-containing protein [Rhizobium leguminosarum]|uniref:DUF930 domain-containing protein n=1 Tax=Rhizobium leguminosarum TaxID=384 RepID=UPI001C952276|nr:DUF930 domain-containing protein [Rhizobium leguminosarum]MBY5769103.1 DUF930 domain-containing protein [Rhizobium leguminosarum]MBY5782220.1 DUF930 domain-containing protein [Rhizobium leguminosarum]